MSIHPVFKKEGENSSSLLLMLLFNDLNDIIVGLTEVNVCGEAMFTFSDRLHVKTTWACLFTNVREPILLVNDLSEVQIGLYIRYTGK